MPPSEQTQEVPAAPPGSGRGFLNSSLRLDFQSYLWKAAAAADAH